MLQYGRIAVPPRLPARLESVRNNLRTTVYSGVDPMRMRRFTATLALGLCLAALPGRSVSGASDPPDAREILRRSEEVRSPDLDYAVDFTLVVSNPNTIWKERRARYTMIAHGKDLSLVLMREPRQFHPGTLLIMRNLYWLLFPKSTKPIQLSARHIFNGDISNGDLARGNLLENYEPRLDGEEKADGRKCFRLELTRTSNVAHFPRIRTWIDRKKLRPVMSEYYGRTGALLKTVHFGDYRNGTLGVRPMRLEVETHERAGERTTMEFTNLRRLDSARLDFTPEGLIHFRDAALARLAAEGEQAQPEDLITMIHGEAP